MILGRNVDVGKIEPIQFATHGDALLIQPPSHIVTTQLPVRAKITEQLNSRTVLYAASDTALGDSFRSFSLNYRS
jgi:hypothetical protein